MSVSTLRKLEPFDPEHPNDFRVVYETPNGIERTHMSVDTEQSAMQWRRAFEGALFRHAHSMWRSQHAKKMGLEPSSAADDQWTMMRACVPLDRIKVSGMQDYHNFVTLLGLEIDLRGEKVDFSPENDLEADHDGHQEHDHPAAAPSLGLERTDSPAVMSAASTVRAPPMSPPALDGQGRFHCEKTNKLVSRLSSRSHVSSTSELKAPSPARTPSQVSTKSTDGTTSPGIDTPTKKFSLRNTLDKLAPSHSHSHSRDPSPARQPKASTGPQWLDSTIPGPMAKAAGGITSGKPEDWNESGPESEYSFNVAVQQEQTWFVGSLQSAVAEAQQRRYKAGAKRPKMVMNVAGYDCLVTDEDLDHTIKSKSHEDASSDSEAEHDSPEEMEDGPEVSRPSMLKVKAARKAEKASMAAKIFGLNEEDGIWRMASKI